MSELEQENEVKVVEEEAKNDRAEATAETPEKTFESEVETKVVEQSEVESEEVLRIDDDPVLTEVKEARKRIRPQVIKRAKTAQTEVSEKPKNVQTKSVYSNRFWGFLKGGKNYGD